MVAILNGLEFFLKKIDYYRDELLFCFIRPCWPREITPNYVTWTRVLVSVILFILLFFFGIENKLLIILLFTVGALTDLLDGSIARGLNKVTEFGAMLDSTADRLLILPIAIYSLYQSQKLLLALLLLIEAFNAITSIYYKSKEIYLESEIFGKTKMALLCIVFGVILIVWPKPPSIFFIDILWVSIIFSFLSIFSRIVELKNKGYITNKIINKQLNIKK